jgi:hypothetical protein
MKQEKNQFKKKSLPKSIMPYYRRAIEVGNGIFDLSPIEARIKALDEETIKAESVDGEVGR